MIVVDDGSRDGTRELLGELEKAASPPFRLILHPQNRGKGAALRTGFAAATGDVVLVQDADLEYDPRDYPQLLQPILDERGRRGLRLALPGRAAPRAVLLALRRQPAS